MLNRRYQLLLLAVIALAAYYPAVLSGFSNLDDSLMVESLRGGEDWNRFASFASFSGTNLYYRPLLVLTFLIDKHYLGLLPGLMHLENILFHLLNSVLVYFLTLYIIQPTDKSRSYLPLLAAMFFCLHPVNTESVNWISGRTDVLAGMFVLMSALCIFKFRECHEKKYVTLSVLAFLGGALVKETAVAFLPGAFLLASAAPPNTELGGRLGKTNDDRLDNSGYTKLILGSVLVALFFYLPRFATIRSHTNRVGLTLMAVSDDWTYSLFVVLRAFGFYMKKLIFPFPLNLAIIEVSPLYEVLAVILVVACLYIVTRRTVISAVFTSGVLLITPSFMLAFGQIAWTPYAERYVYISSAFIIPAAVVYMHDAFAVHNLRITKIVVVAFLAIFFFGTLSRSILWRNNTELFRDTVEKSPTSVDARLNYSELLIEKGAYAEALDQIKQGRKLPSLGYDERFDLFTAQIYSREGRLDEAIKLCETGLRKTKGYSIKMRGYLVELLEKKKQACRMPKERRLLDKKIFTNKLSLFKLSREPRLLYELGIMAAALGDNKRAVRLFEQAGDRLHDDDPLRKLAKLQIASLSEKIPREHTHGL